MIDSQEITKIIQSTQPPASTSGGTRKMTMAQYS